MVAATLANYERVALTPLIEIFEDSFEEDETLAFGTDQDLAPEPNQGAGVGWIIESEESSHS